MNDRNYTYEDILFELDKCFDSVLFDPSKELLYESGVLCLSALSYEKRANTHLIGILVQAGPAGLPSVPLLQYLTYGIFNRNQLVRSGRTDNRGHLFVELPDGDYRIRFAATPYTRAERMVLESVGDPDAEAILEECFEVGIGVGEAFAIAAYEDEIAFESDSQSKSSNLPEGVNAGLSKDGNWFQIDYPIDEQDPNAVQFKFGCAMVEIVT